MEIKTNIKPIKANRDEKNLNQSKTHLEKFTEIGFIGCIEAESDLAENTESILNQEMRRSQ